MYYQPAKIHTSTLRQTHPPIPTDTSTRVHTLTHTQTHTITNDIHPSWGLPSKMLPFTWKLNKCEIRKFTKSFTHTRNNKTWGREWSPDGVEVLIEKASSFQEFAAEEKQHNKVIKKGCEIRQGLSQDCHTPTDMNLHKQITFPVLFTLCERVFLFDCWCNMRRITKHWEVS